MNCRTSQFELSQCLDGRLASGRRAAVMQHIAACSVCAQFWDELQRAQDLVLRLPQQRIGDDFRDGLFARIQSGEGTPDAVFHEPVPLGTKVRYVLTGAAAAAVVLAVAGLWRGRGPTPDERTNVAAVPAHAPASAPDRLKIRTSPPNEVAASSSWNALQQLTPATPGVVATEAALHFQDSFDAANRSARTFELQPSDRAATLLCNNAREMRQFGSLLLDLRDRDHLSFSDGHVDDQLHDLVASLDDQALGQNHDTAARHVVVPVLHRVANLRTLPQSLLIRPVLSPTEQMRFLRLFTERPNVMRQMFEILPDPGFDPLSLPTPGRFSFADDNHCSLFVIVRQR